MGLSPASPLLLKIGAYVTNYVSLSSKIISINRLLRLVCQRGTWLHIIRVRAAFFKNVRESLHSTKFPDTWHRVFRTLGVRSHSDCEGTSQIIGFYWLIWYSTKRAYVIMICPSCIVVVRCQHHPASASVHSPPSHRIQDRNFIFSMNMHMCPQYMHIKYLVILTCSF